MIFKADGVLKWVKITPTVQSQKVTCHDRNVTIASKNSTTHIGNGWSNQLQIWQKLTPVGRCSLGTRKHIWLENNYCYSS